MSEYSHRNVFYNTASNYILMALRILQGILITRWLYHYLGDSYYGFWSLLWAFFSYLIIFNLGFGVAAQKYTAEKLYHLNGVKYNKIISMIFSSYFIVSILILVIVFIANKYIDSWTGISGGEGVYREVLFIFGVGLAIIFPLTIFGDILGGLHLIWLRNTVMFFTRICEILAIVFAIWFDWGFLSIVIFTIGINIISGIVNFIFVKRKISGFKISFVLEKKIFKEISNFSIFAYINSIANLVIYKSDRFVLGAMMNLNSVATYQIGTRLSEISETLSMQFQDNVVPMSANLIKEDKIDRLKKFLISGIRFNSFVSVGVGAILYCLAGETIGVLFAVENVTAVKLCQIFLISQFFTGAMKSIPSRYLLASGKHKFISCTTVFEAIVKICLSIFLCYRIGIFGVAFGTLIPNIIISVFIVLPLMVSELKFRKMDLLKAYIKPMFAVVPSIVICIVVKEYYGAWAKNFFGLAGIYSVVFGLYFVLSLLFVLGKDEKKKLLNRFGMGRYEK